MKRSLKTLLDAAKNWNRDNVVQYAAAVSFYTLFSIAPITIIAVTVAGVFFGRETATRELEEAAATLGASRWYTFRRVTLPTIRPALAAGAVLAWARALGEFGATITFAGNFPGTTQTLPLSVYLSLQSNPEAALVLALVLIAVSFIVLVGLRERWFARPGVQP